MSELESMANFDKEKPDHASDILIHEPVPGYKTVFHITVAVASLYLLLIFAL